MPEEVRMIAAIIGIGFALIFFMLLDISRGLLGIRRDLAAIAYEIRQGHLPPGNPQHEAEKNWPP